MNEKNYPYKFSKDDLFVATLSSSFPFYYVSSKQSPTIK